jgi:hypothetical protein
MAAILERQTIVSYPKSFYFRYFGWPTVARLEDGTLALAASGFRHAHMCPWGKSVVWESHDEGRTWEEPEIVNDSSIDDRDTGLLALPGGKLLLTWFSSDMRHHYPAVPLDERQPKVDKALEESGDPAQRKKIRDSYRFVRATTDVWNEENVARDLGSFVRIRDSRGVWGPRIPVTVSSPHGPIMLRDGTLFYIGKANAESVNGEYRPSMKALHGGRIRVIGSTDKGVTWHTVGEVPDVADVVFHEPHAIELADGSLLALLRVHPVAGGHFQIWKSLSRDGGRTWSTPEYLAAGSPPHLLRHSSGAIVCTQGYRIKPFGVRAIISRDEGGSWEEFVIDDSQPDGDLGYPASVELADGSVYTVYYRDGDLLSVKWKLN